MTEAEWFACGDFRDLLASAEPLLRGWPHGRTPRLMACAACRVVWDRLTDPRLRESIETAERYADGAVSRKALAAAHPAALSAARQSRGGPAAVAAKASRPNVLRLEPDVFAMNAAGRGTGVG
jgi:hypothetical protein